MNTPKPSWLTRIAVFAVALSVVAACDDSTGPSQPPLTPESASDVMNDVVTTFFDDNDAAVSLGYFGDFIGTALGGGPPLAPAEMGTAATAPWQRSLLSTVEDVPANIPEIWQGVTFEWNEVEGSYGPSERSGAPADGVRFILYAVNPITELPVSPLNEIGYLDIIDTSTFPSINISLAAVVGGETLISVNATGLYGETSATLSIDGFLSDGTEQLDLSMTATESQTMFSIAFEVSIGNFSASQTITFTETQITLEAVLTDGVNELVFMLGLELDIGGYTITEGSGIYYNDELVALISGSFGETTSTITITNAEGDPLTEAELIALGEVFELMEELSDFFDGVLDFAVELINLGAN